MTDSLRDLATELEQFARERDWGRYHAPKNLACALMVEAAELLEHFQWLTEAESRQLEPAVRDQVATEIADVLLYLVQLSSALGIDPVQAAREKIKVNARKYPVALAKGTNKKADKL